MPILLLIGLSIATQPGISPSLLDTTPHRTMAKVVPKPAKPRTGPSSVKELQGILESHKQWLLETQLGGQLGTLASFSTLDSGKVEGSLSASITIQDSGTGVQHTLTVTQGPRERLYYYCNRLAASLEAQGLRLGGRRADLRHGQIYDAAILAAFRGADLRCADLTRAGLSGADLEHASLTGANLSGAELFDANLTQGVLIGSELRNAYLWHANLTGADLTDADLSEADLSAADLKSANASFAAFHRARFEPRDVTDFQILGATGLSSLTFRSPYAATRLRKTAKEFALRSEERELTSAIHKSQLARAPLYSRLFEDFALGGKLTDYGAHPWSALVLMILPIPVFALAYTPALSPGGAGIWVVYFTDGVLEKKERSARITNRYPFLRPFPRRTSTQSTTGAPTRAVRLRRGAAIALQFSLLSAFQIGWHEFNIGSWITRLQTRGYTLRGTGWVRRVAGLQSLLSVYLLALWAITYFGNPFE
jgi:hypothetical protein